MTPSRSPIANSMLACASLLVLAAMTTACGSRSRDLEPGSYRAVLELPGGELPFGLDVAQEEGGLVLYLVNGDERVRVDEVTVADGRVTATMPGHGNTLTAEVRGGKLTGEVSLLQTGDERQVLPLRAEAGKTWRFFEQPSTDNADVAGRWSVTLTNDQGQQSPGVAEFTQSFERVTGTLLTPTGDHRVLVGEVKGDELFLSRFDGASAHLFKARVTEDGALVGDFWSGKTSHQTFRADREK